MNKCSVCSQRIKLRTRGKNGSLSKYFRTVNLRNKLELELVPETYCTETTHIVVCTETTHISCQIFSSLTRFTSFTFSLTLMPFSSLTRFTCQIYQLDLDPSLSFTRFTCVVPQLYHQAELTIITQHLNNTVGRVIQRLNNSESVICIIHILYEFTNTDSFEVPLSLSSPPCWTGPQGTHGSRAVYW